MYLNPFYRLCSYMVQKKIERKGLTWWFAFKRATSPKQERNYFQFLLIVILYIKFTWTSTSYQLKIQILCNKCYWKLIFSVNNDERTARCFHLYTRNARISIPGLNVIFFYLKSGVRILEYFDRDSYFFTLNIWNSDFTISILKKKTRQNIWNFNCSKLISSWGQRPINILRDPFCNLFTQFLLFYVLFCSVFALGFE